MNDLLTLIIHPDPEVRTTIRRYLSQADGFRVLGEAVSAFEATRLLDAIPYRIFFLGVDLPDGVSGIELAQMLQKRKVAPALVFIAEDESLAFTAFELGGVDYLLWPLTEERMQKTFERLKKLKTDIKETPEPRAWDSEAAEPQDEETLSVPLEEEEQERFLTALRQAWDYSQERQPEIEKLPVNLDGKTMLVPYHHIVFVEAYEDYSYVHTAMEKYLTSYRLKHLEDRLRKHRFFRVHRKFLVNLDMVTEIASLPGGNFMLRTTGKKRIELPISRRRIAELKQILGL